GSRFALRGRAGFFRAAGGGLNVVQKLAQIVSLQAAFKGNFRRLNVDLFDVNLVRKDRSRRHPDAHGSDLNCRPGFETVRVANEQTLQPARTAEQRKGRAVEFDFGPGDLRADGLDALFDDGPEEVDAQPNGRR